MCIRDRATATATIDLNAIRQNWQKLRRLSSGDTAAVVKANAYGLGVKQVASALYNEGARIFFIATAEEGAELRSIVGKIPDIYIFSGHMTGDTDLIKNYKFLNISFVAKKKLGNAVIRNKIKRRLRNIFDGIVKNNEVNFEYSYLFIAKKNVFDDDFEKIKGILTSDLKKIKK